MNCLVGGSHVRRYPDERDNVLLDGESICFDLDFDDVIIGGVRCGGPLD